MRLLPCLGLVVRPWRFVQDIVQPAMPFRRHLGGFRRAIIDDPAARAPGRADAPPVFIIFVAEAVLADSGAVAGGVEAGGKRRAVPPCEEIAENTHGPVPVLS